MGETLVLHVLKLHAESRSPTFINFIETHLSTEHKILRCADGVGIGAK